MKSSSKKASLLNTLNNGQDAKAKRLREFKQ